MKGAPRYVKDSEGRIPADYIKDVNSAALRKSLTDDLDDPRGLSCLAITKQPMKKLHKNYTTVMFMWFLMALVYVAAFLFIFPRKLHNFS